MQCVNVLDFSEKVANLYNELMLTNEDLLMGFRIRSENHKETQKLLSEINQTLYRAQRLRGEVLHFIT